MAAMLDAAALPIRLQFGEILWWFQANASGMAFYDTDTVAAALAAGINPLHTFLTPNDDRSVNGCADANFLRARLKRPTWTRSGPSCWRMRTDGQFFNLFNHPNFGLPVLGYAGLPGKPVTQTGFGALSYTTSPPTGLLGVGLGGDSSTRMIAF